MPAIQSGKILVSGANGFIAAWVVRALLEQGFSVRGTVRSADRCSHLRTTFAEYGDKFELLVVPDITQEGAFDEAVKGVDAIEHTASPFHLRADAKPEDFIVPAVQGTVGILKSALKHGDAIKRIVITGSCASVLQNEPKPTLFSEKDWNNQAPREVSEAEAAGTSDTLPTMTKYRASKTLAERAAWALYEENKGKIGWDLVVLNPPFVFGPTIHDTPTPETLNTSALQFYDMLTKPNPNPSVLLTGSCWVDVRDLGRAHVLALLKSEVAGQRIIVSEGPWVWQDWLDAAPPSDKYQKGNPGSGKNVVHHIMYDARRSVEVLGMKYRTTAETTKDTVADWEARGW
ncbi:D-lactaldehyde dehydrogenase [Roridomyces roridus]|uniref:D-lactaldehyde dehydrogenase n=1 Tax=Roridomyces roridus TaxID=1738132 RepID=A0AAD7BDR0_9AGAR|nr:D-lactaldehyde dehydrogenase [Roridomyces roridus]